MFRSLLYDHPQGLSFVFSAFSTFPLFASSFAFFGMWPYAVYVCVCVSGVPVCGLSGRELSTRQPTDRYTGHTYT
jgi:hypothetical protein